MAPAADVLEETTGAAHGVLEYLRAQRDALGEIAIEAGMTTEERDAYVQAAEDGFLLGLRGGESRRR